MTNLFTVRTDEISLLDESHFLENGGVELHFGAVDGNTVCLHAVGSRTAITTLARDIVRHHTAAR